MRKLSLAALLFLNCILVFAQYTPSTVPNTKLVNNSYVSNPDGIISETTVARIDSALANLEKQTTTQVSVVVIRSIGDADIFEFAQELFNLWGIGRSNDNGLLILLVEDQRTVRFHTGRETEAVLPDARCKRIERDQMIPSFKEGDYDSGMLNGVTEVVRILTDPNYSVELTAPEDDDVVLSNYAAFVVSILIFLGPAFLIAWAVKAKRFADSKPPARTDYPQMRLRRMTWLIEFGGIPLLILFVFWFGDPDSAGTLCFLTLYIYLMGTVFHRVLRERRMIKGLLEKRKYFEITEYLRKSQWYWLFMAIFFPVPFLGYFPFHFVRKNYYRNHARKCAQCDGDMKKLSEAEDDQFLSKSQLVEESIHSVNYDVWQCKGCGATEAWHFLNKLSKYDACPSCKTIAYYRVSHRTVVSATYTRAGSGEEVHQCKACGKSVRSTYSIAKLTPSSSSSSSSSSGGSSSSSSGGSWGGGSSGGGSASSSW